MTFAEALTTKMDEKGLNATTLSDKSGVAKPYISQLVNGKLKDPAFSKACALISALGMTAQEFREYMEQAHE